MQSMKRSFRRTFLTGLIFILPILISVWLVRLVFDQVSHTITPLVLNVLRFMDLGEWSESVWVNYAAPTLSVGLAIFLIWFIGLVGSNVFGRQVLQGFEKLMLQVPVVKSIYSATRQFLDTFSNASNKAFKEVVLIEYPRPGIWTMAFVTNERGSGEVQKHSSDNLLSLFIPTTPNPTSGWLVFVPERECRRLAMSVDDAFKMIISGGVLTPGGGERRGTTADEENWVAKPGVTGERRST